MQRLVGKTVTRISPTSNVPCRGMARSTSAAAGTRRHTARAVPTVAYSGGRYCLTSVASPETWSECSWVSRTPDRSRGDSPSSRRAAVMRRAEMPASSRTWVPSPLTSRLLPSEPLASICTVSNGHNLTGEEESPPRGAGKEKHPPRQAADRAAASRSGRWMADVQFSPRASRRRCRQARPQGRCPRPRRGACPPDPRSRARYS